MEFLKGQALTDLHTNLEPFRRDELRESLISNGSGIVWTRWNASLPSRERLMGRDLSAR